MPDPARARILEAARGHFFAHGFQAITTEELARELGMSKKTLYRHFASKEALLDALLDDFAAGVGGMLRQLFAVREQTIAERLRRMLEGVAARLSPIQPVFLLSLKRSAPAQFARIEELRRQTLRHHLVPLIEAGRATGEIRPDLDAAFVVDLLIELLHRVLDPETLSRLNLLPAQAVPRALDLVFHGIFTVQPRRHR